MSDVGKLLYRARWPLWVLVGTLIFTRWLTAPGVQPADSGEFQLVARELGIAHPPGYALYTMAAHGWGRLATWEQVGRFLGADPALWSAHRPLDADPWTWATNAFSALLAVLTLGLVYRTGFLLAGARAGGVAAAFILMLVPTFQIQSAVANIRMPTALFTALLIYLTCRWLVDESVRSTDIGPPAPDWRLAALALVAGLAAGHHGSLAFVALAAALVVVTRRPAVLRDGRTLAAVLGAIVLSLLPQLYLPVRDFQDALFAEGHLRTLAGVVNHVTAADFRGDLLSLRDTNTLLDRGGVLGNVLVLQFWPLLLLVGVVGIVWLTRRQRGAATLLAGIVGLTAAVSVVYKAPQTVEYLMPAYVALSLASGVVFGAVWQRNRAGRLVAAVGIVGLALALWTSASMMPVGQRASGTPGWLLSVFGHSATPVDTTILAAWHYAMPLLYAQRHLVERPDVQVQYVFPEGSEAIGATWLRRMREAPGPVMLTNRPREAIDAEVSLWPVPGTPFFLSVTTPDRGKDRLEHWGRPANFGDQVQLSRYTNRRLIDEALGGPMPQPIDLDLEFKALRPVTETLTLVAQLLDTDAGAVIAQADEAIPAGRWNEPGGVGVVLPLVPFRGASPTNRLLRVGVYRTTARGPELLPFHGDTFDGMEYMPLAGVTVMTAPNVSNSDIEASGVPFGNAMTLLDTSVQRLADQLLVDLTWRADETAARSDYTVSVQAHGEGWQAQDDGTPAMGAIPTLKWLPGQVIHDRHRIQLPADLPADAPFHVTVGVYDAFSLEPLPVTDAERVRQGQGQAAEVWRQGG